MAFAALPIEEQQDQVSAALQALLGDTPSTLDDMMLCHAARDIAIALEIAMVERPLPTWGAGDVVSAASSGQGLTTINNLARLIGRTP